MSGLEDRKKSFENKFALDESNLFKAEARASKNFGLWLAQQLGFSGEEANSYAIDVVGANLEEPGFDDVLRFVMPDVEKSSLTLTREELDTKIHQLFEEAQQEIKNEDAA